MKRYRQAQLAGNLYYVRLKTSAGYVYKLGFTTMRSVHERLAFQGGGDEELIDKVFLFNHFDDAFDMEEQLHHHFRDKAVFRKKYPKSNGPLYKNGQSELYVEDILKLDSSYTQARGELTLKDLKVADLEHRGLTTEAANKSLALGEKLSVLTKLLLYPIYPVLIVIGWLSKLFGDDSELKEAIARSNARTAKNEAACAAIMSRIHKAVIAQATAVAKEAAEHGPDDYRLIVATRELARQTRVYKLKLSAVERKIAHQVMMAIEAMKHKDLTRFEELVHIDMLVFNLAQAMTSDYMTVSDYAIPPNNVMLVNLCNAMFEPGANPRDLLLRPVEDTYKKILRHYVETHMILTEDILLPAGPLYEFYEDHDLEERNGLAVYFGLGAVLDDFGRDITLQDAPLFTNAGDGLTFPIRVRNAKTRFEGDLILKASMTDRGRLALDFPNFRALQRECEAASEAVSESAAPT